MKSKLFLWPLSLVMAASLVFTGCKDDDDDVPANNTTRLTATLNGQQEVPATTSAATGTFTGSIDRTTRVMTYEVRYSGFTPTAGHIHAGSPGQNGPVVIPFNSLTSPITGQTTLAQSRIDSMVAGRFYVNLHSAAFPGGEIRGNITEQK
ncbi:CHRD domain-containing protein [Tellurirhabdus rosea]|uniref:CHRD domain-containing protein n=1 Tax=Tellurirhabdus rosea TaxID=2674997 RepID=UPI00225442DF|nr:CHRD domain-containing protein [Tellurirhabdus rosea]